MRAFLPLLLLAACSKPAPSSTQAPVESVTAEDLDLPIPEPAPPLATSSGPLTPWIAESATWKRRGPPPTTYSLFSLPEGSSVLVYATMTRDACEAELDKRKIAFRRAADLPGVRAPVQLDGPLHGVTYRSRAPHTEIDCRLVLALDDFSVALAARDVIGAQVYSSYRSPSENGCTDKYAGEQHCAALAVDIGQFDKRDKTKLVVEKDFHGRIGSLTCKSGVGPKPVTPAATELWDLVCGAAGRQFSVILTPNWNQQHKNHFHLELTTHDWVLVR
ncbi:MAG: extensin family protein [Labilithrix sp.]|nr:extensin family protein [Labilithrix sp.]MCW5813291.1 extensin family protein [Labilithrix sp.]